MAIYLNLTSASNISIDTFANLNVITTSYMIIWHKTSAFKEYIKIIDSELTKHADEVMVLNINDYHSIHIKWMSNITITFITTYLTTILINPIIA